MRPPEQARITQTITRGGPHRRILFVCPRLDLAMYQAEQMGFPDGVQFIQPGGAVCGQCFEEIWVDADCYRHDDSGRLQEYIDMLRCRLELHGRMRFLT